MKAEDLGAIRVGAEMQAVKPYIDSEIEGMKKAVVSSILQKVNDGSLTPDVALSKWVEYVAYIKLQQKYEQRIRMGQSIGAAQGNSLDINMNRV